MYLLFKRRFDLMKYRIILFFFLAAAGMMALPPFSNFSNAGDVRLVTVRKGDTVSYLSFKIYGMYNQKILDLLVRENPGVADMNLIYAGQELRFPAPAVMKTLLGDRKPEAPHQDAKEMPKPQELKKSEAFPQVKATAAKAVITYLEGQVQVKKSPAAAWSAAAPNQILYAGSEIKVLRKSRAELILDNQSVMRLSENTQLVLRRLDTDPASRKETTGVGLSLGKLWTKASKVFNPSSRLEVRTPTAIAGVQGTVYQVNVENEHRTEIQVYDGAVAVSNPLPSAGTSPAGTRAVLTAPSKVQGPQPVAGPTAVSREAWTEIILRKAQQITVTDQGIPRPVAFSIDQEKQKEWVQWNDKRDADFQPPERPR